MLSLINNTTKKAVRKIDLFTAFLILYEPLPIK